MSYLLMAPLTGMPPNLYVSGTEGVTIPSGTTAQRPSDPNVGELRFNTTSGCLEVYNGSSW